MDANTRIDLKLDDIFVNHDADVMAELQQRLTKIDRNPLGPSPG